ncbi:hypothetical protein AB2L27_19805 [Kineococcus sp. LSe6-4]|uniref:Uncharacterized protein n=1 Tax=Kineococcus halophytocola TaxID=3234027 RepID=A0ABV4H5Z5_9ACTN
MAAIFPGDLGATDRVRYAERVEAAGPALLSELATWVDNTWEESRHGPRTQLDGTVTSITPLVTWLFDFADAGLPGIPPTVRRFNWIPPAQPDVDEDVTVRRDYAAAAVDAYIAAVLLRYDSAARWQPLRTPGRVPDVWEGWPHVYVHGTPVDLASGPLLKKFFADRPGASGHPPRDPVWFTRQLTRQLPADVVEKDLPADPTFLPAPGRTTPDHPWEPFEPSPTPKGQPATQAEQKQPVPRPAGAEDAPRLRRCLEGDFVMTVVQDPRITDEGFFEVRESTATDTRDESEDEDGEGVDQEEVDLMQLAEDGPALSARGLHRELLALGFEHQGVLFQDRPRAPRLDRTDEQYVFYGAEAVLLAETFHERGRLRYVFFQWLNQPGCSSTSPTGRWLAQQLQSTATQHSARLIAADTHYT